MPFIQRNGAIALVCAGLLLAATPTLQASNSDAPAPARASSPDEAVTPDWVTRSQDNICGLRDPRTLTHPAKVDYEQLLDATPEMKKLERKGIDPNSAEGIQLRQAAIDRVAKAAKSVMTNRGHCSVWKEIRHKDGRAIPDITQEVLKSL